MNQEAVQPYRICVVCTGNTCRSPITEGILKSLATEKNLSHWEITSGGLYAFQGAMPSEFGVEASAEHGIDISGHKARLFDKSRAEQSDLILVHSGEHMLEIASWRDAAIDKTYLLKHFPESGDPGPQAWVEDPVGQNLDRYRWTFLELDEVLRRIVPHIRARAERGAS